MQFPYVIQAQYEHRTSADTHLQYLCAQEQRIMLPTNESSVEIKPANGPGSNPRTEIITT